VDGGMITATASDWAKFNLDFPTTNNFMIGLAGITYAGS
jgi:hypothetical protein